MKSVRLIRLAWVILAFILVDLVFGFLGGKEFAVSLVVLAITAAAAIATWRTEREDEARKRHAEQSAKAAQENLRQLKDAIAAHCEQLRRHVLAIDKFFALGAASDATAKIDAALKREQARDPGTGPFPVYNGGIW